MMDFDDDDNDGDGAAELTKNCVIRIPSLFETMVEKRNVASRIPQSAAEFRRVPQSSAEFHKVPQSSTEFHRVPSF